MRSRDIRRLRTKFIPSSSFRKPRAVRDSSRFLSVSVVAATAATTTWGVQSLLFSCGGRFCLEVGVPAARPAALRVPCTDDLIILVNDLVGGLVFPLPLPLLLASNDAREGAPEGIWRCETRTSHVSRHEERQ